MSVCALSLGEEVTAGVCALSLGEEVTAGVCALSLGEEITAGVCALSLGEEAETSCLRAATTWERRGTSPTEKKNNNIK